MNKIPKTLDEALGLVVKAKREAKGQTQDEFAEHLTTLSVQALRRREAGESVWGVEELFDVCAALKLSFVDVVRAAKERLTRAQKAKTSKRKKTA